MGPIKVPDVTWPNALATASRWALVRRRPKEETSMKQLFTNSAILAEIMALSSQLLLVVMIGMTLLVAFDMARVASMMRADARPQRLWRASLRRLRWISEHAAMVGLLGTVLGLMEALNAPNDPLATREGLGVVFSTTALGLVMTLAALGLSAWVEADPKHEQVNP